MTRTIFLPRSFMAALFAFIYILGFIIAPYWINPQSTTRMIAYLSLIISIGIMWVYLSTNSFEIQVNPRDYFVGCLILMEIVLLNYRPLNSVIPFRGDEGLHIDRTLALVTIIPLGWTFGVLLLFILLMYSAIKRPRWAIFIGTFTVASVIWFFLKRNPFDDIEQPQFFLRYPFINYWFFAVAPKLASLITNPYHEILYRIIPVLSMGALAWSFQKRLSVSEIPLNLALGLTVATIPIVFYYSSILYIDPPAILLMTIVCLEMKSLLHENGRKLTQNPCWYILILIGFIKETTIPFLLCLLACRVVIQLRKWFTSARGDNSTNSFTGFLTSELGIIFSVLAPAFLYLYFRSTLTSTRSFTPHVSNLFDPLIYPLISRSLIEQFGPLLLFFICGGILLITRKDYSTLLCYTLLIAATLGFYITDNKGLVGYSRFNLSILPPILAVSNIFIGWIFLQKRVMGILLVFSALFINLLISPVYLDGTKVPYWGNYITDTSEHYYPYQDALIWLKDNHRNEHILFTGLDYQYSFQFYWNKLDWHPKRDGLITESTGNETIAVSKILDKAERENFNVVVYRVLGRNFIQPLETGNFHVKIVRNSAHTLMIYYKKP